MTSASFTSSARRTGSPDSRAATVASSMLRSSPDARATASLRITIPSEVSPLMSSWPASSLRAISSRQPAETSPHAWTVHCAGPTEPTVNSPAQRTPLWWASSGCIGASDHRRSPFPRQRTTARRTSWPSRKMSAETGMVSPTVRLIGQRPSSIVGRGSWMRIRGGGAWLRGWAGTSSALFPISSVPNVAAMKFTRSSGVQLHLTSLPGGRLGPQAYRFVDWLEGAGQAWWQVLPLGPPDRAGSPYKACSAFAAWRGLLADPTAPVSDEEAAAFRAKHAAWIDDWAAFAGGARAVNDQVRFDREWGALRAYAAERGVRMIGDVPIYVAPGSADHVAHPELFRDDVVAGAPPDYFSEKGQLWGNPIYDWPALRRRRYGWWLERFRRVFDLFDLARIDHFRGFVAYWAVPRGASDARPGRR